MEAAFDNFLFSVGDSDEVKIQSNLLASLD